MQIMNEVQEEACKDKFNCSQVNEAYYHALSMQGSFSVSSSSFFFLLLLPCFQLKWLSQFNGQLCGMTLLHIFVPQFLFQHLSLTKSTEKQVACSRRKYGQRGFNLTVGDCVLRGSDIKTLIPHDGGPCCEMFAFPLVNYYPWLLLKYMPTVKYALWGTRK